MLCSECFKRKKKDGWRDLRKLVATGAGLKKSSTSSPQKLSCIFSSTEDVSKVGNQENSKPQNRMDRKTLLFIVFLSLEYTLCHSEMVFAQTPLSPWIHTLFFFGYEGTKEDG